MTDASSARPLHNSRQGVPDFDRRTVLRTAAWALPAVSVVSATPAFAASEIPPICATVTATLADWSVTSGAINNPSGDRSTGWLKRGTYTAKYVSESEAQWFNGTGTQGPGSTNEPDGSFISFANNSSTTAPAVVTVSYNFQMTGSGWVDVAGSLKFGYGNSGTNPQWTERQLVDVELVDGATTYPLARLAHQRRGTPSNANAAVYLPTNATAATYTAMLNSDAELRGIGYALHLAAPSGGHNTVATYGPSTQLNLISGSTAPRTITINYKLTLPRRHTATGVTTVNDDVILNPPTVKVYC